MDVQILALDDPRWLQVLDGIRHDVYHLPAYVSIESKRLKSPAEAIVVQDKNKILFCLTYFAPAKMFALTT